MSVTVLISGGPGNPAKLAAAEEGIGYPAGTLLVPTCNNRAIPGDRPFAIDNGAFAGFKEGAFLDVLAKARHARDRCLFVAVPDVVGSARRTLEVFDYWTTHRSRDLLGWPLALVMQDGQEDLPIPWSRIEAVFIGGSTVWKMSKHAEHCIRAAQALGKHTHVGRVNTADRFRHFKRLGVDSIDGSGLAWREDRQQEIREMEDARTPLFTDLHEAA